MPHGATDAPLRCTASYAVPMTVERTTVERSMIRRSVLLSGVALAAVVVLYALFVRTRWGQEVDDLAFEGRAAVSPTTTQRTDRLLNAVTESSLVLLGGAIVLLALAQRRVRLAVVVGTCMAGAVGTTEVLKLYVLTRPRLAGVDGIVENSFPSGHATIGMVLSLGLVMVSASSWRRVVTVIAALMSTAFGTAVLASGWHRPSDSLGAYCVALAWFAVGHAVLLWLDGHRPYPHGVATSSDRRPSLRLLVGAGVALLAFTTSSLWRSLADHDLHSVVYAGWYVLFCVAIDAFGIVVVLTLAVLTGERARERRERDAAVPQPE